MSTEETGAVVLSGDRKGNLSSIFLLWVVICLYELFILQVSLFFCAVSEPVYAVRWRSDLSDYRRVMAFICNYEHGGYEEVD